MLWNKILKISLLGICFLVVFSVRGNVRDRGYVLVINSYTDGTIAHGVSLRRKCVEYGKIYQ